MFLRKFASIGLISSLCGVTACVGATPNVAVRKVVVSATNGEDASVAKPSSEIQPGAGVAADPNAVKNQAPNAGAADPAGGQNPGDAGMGAAPEAVVDPNLGSQEPQFRWIVMGDFDLGNLADVRECLAGTQQRSACSTQNDRCRSSFVTSCPSGNCRRLFKCVTGQNSSLVWFPMDDGTTLSQAAGATPAYGLCSLDKDVAGSSCSNGNERCLSRFCTDGSGDGCGRRVFKCLISGVPGKFFYRWMGDKSVGELQGIPTCTIQQNIAGSECAVEESKCVSSFFTDTQQTKRRLFKCTP